MLTALADAPRRYSDLARTVAGVSQKMLTQTLRTLERDGLVTRSVTASVPVVDYQLTALGRTILPVVSAIKQWSETHIDEIHSARTAYDHPPADVKARRSSGSASSSAAVDELSEESPQLPAVGG